MADNNKNLNDKALAAALAVLTASTRPMGRSTDLREPNVGAISASGR